MLVSEYERILAGGPSPKKAQEDEVVGAQSEKSDASDRSPSSLDDRLATLKRVKGQHFITEDGYQRQKRIARPAVRFFL